MTATFEVEREFISWRTLVLPSKKSFKSSRFSTTEKTSLKKQGKRIWRKKNKKIFYIFSDLWPSLGWSSLALLHLVALKWSSSSLKKSSFFWQEIWILQKMENRNTRLGGVPRRRALGDLTSQLNNRPTNFQNQDTLQPIKQVRIFGFRTLTFWICGRFVLFLAHCGPLTIVTEKFFLLLMLSALLFNRKGGQWTDSMGHFSSDLT